MSTSPISPPEEDLKTAIAFLKKEHPALGIAKLHALLRSDNPSWTVSEKRLRRFLKNSEPHVTVYPSSALVEGLDVAKWTTAVEVKFFDKRRGKGLVAKEPIHEGQVVWKEGPFAIAPEW